MSDIKKEVDAVVDELANAFDSDPIARTARPYIKDYAEKKDAEIKTLLGIIDTHKEFLSECKTFISDMKAHSEKLKLINDQKDTAYREMLISVAEGMKVAMWANDINMIKELYDAICRFIKQTDMLGKIAEAETAISEFVAWKQDQ